MRRGFLWTVLGLAALVLLTSMLLSPRGETPLTAQPEATDFDDDAQTLEAQAFKETDFPGPTALPPAGRSTITLATEKTSKTEGASLDGGDELHEAWVAVRIDELRDLSTKTDRASLEAILSELKNPNQEIREAALDAISQSGNRAAIPGLREAAAQTENSQEKQAIAKAIEFISLPTLTEVLSGQGATNNNRPAPEGP
jgi:hypothetical protein